MILTYRYRVKDKHSAELNRMAKAINLVWNFCNDTQKQALKWGKKWPSAYDLQYLTKGSSSILGIGADSICYACAQYAKSRKQQNRPYLRYRGGRSLGWIPLKHKAFGKNLAIYGKKYSLWESRQLPKGGKIRDGGSFSQDASGKWYLNIIVELPPETRLTANKTVGVDLGLKDIATLSGGEKIRAPQHYRKAQERLAKAQRAGKKRQAARLHIKIANQRKDFLHKITTDIVKRFDHVVVGNVNAKALAKTMMAKSVNDVAWSTLRNQLSYKCTYAGGRYEEVNEAYSSQACCECGCISASSPKGAKGLAVRNWICDECGASHDRDVNASRNILSRSGYATRFAGAAA